MVACGVFGAGGADLTACAAGDRFAEAPNHPLEPYPMADNPLALQVFSVRNEFKADPAGTLKRVADIGYGAVEFFGAPNHEPDELRQFLDAAGLQCCGWHWPYDLFADDKLDEAIAFHQALGNRFAVVPAIPEELRRSRADWLALAKRFNQLAAHLAEHGLATGYHNHHVEFAPLEGEMPWDTFFSNTDDRVIMQLDMGNAARGGADVVDILRRYPGRGTLIHHKPYSQRAGKDDPAAGYRPVIGEDDLDWPTIIELCRTTAGTQWHIVEYESDAYEPFEAVEKCLHALNGFGLR